jgi:hypothetical protein
MILERALEHQQTKKEKKKRSHTLQILDVLLKLLTHFVHLQREFRLALKLALHFIELELLAALELLGLLQLLFDLVNLIKV